MLIPDATPLAAGVIPRTRSGHVILFRRTFDPGGGLWAFPGGYVEAGERPADAAERETLEELGMRVRLVLQLVSEGYEDPEAGPAYWRPGDAAALVVFTALALEEPRESDEACEVGVFPADRIPWEELAFWSTHRALGDALADPWPPDG